MTGAGARLTEPDERQPLLPRPHRAASPCTRCLLALSGQHILLLLFVCFLINLAYDGQMHLWAQSVIVSFNADVGCVGGILVSVLFGGMALVTISFDGPEAVSCMGMLGYLLWLFFSAMLCWNSMLRICLLHKLPIYCAFPGYCPQDQESGAPDLSGILRMTVLAWTWVPTGVFTAVGGALWQPWYFIFYVLPHSLLNHTTPWSSRLWSRWRELLVGSVFWFCFILVGALMWSRSFAHAGAHDRRFLRVAGLGISIVCALLAFWFTAAPVMSFWSFLSHPWIVIGEAIEDDKWPPLLAYEEWLAVCLMIWGLGRMLFIVASARFEQWSARARMEEVLREALAHPFRAELEQGFAGMAPTAASASMHEPEPEDPEANRGKIGEMHEALIKARKQNLLEQFSSSAILPSSMRLHVRRDKLLEDSLAALLEKPVSELLAPRVNVLFEGEPGFDVGGLTRDWFDSVGRALADGTNDAKGSSLLAVAPDQTLIPRPSQCNGVDAGEMTQPELQARFRYFMSLGRFMALAVFHEHPLPLSFSFVLCKYLLRVPVGMEDVKQMDPAFYSGRVEKVLRPGGPEQMAVALGEPLTFVSSATDVRPDRKALRPEGETQVVTEDNKIEYVHLLCEDYLCGGIRREIQCLLHGFWDVLPLEVLHQCALGPRELSLMLSGFASLDPDEWREHSTGGASKVHNWFWDVVRELDAEQRCLLLHFTTGSSRLPPGGFTQLKPTFTVLVCDSGSSQHLPHAHTCANQITLPRYENCEQLRSKLLLALSTRDFGLV